MSAGRMLVLGARRMGGGLWSCGIRILLAALLAVCESMGDNDDLDDDGDYDVNDL